MYDDRSTSSTLFLYVARKRGGGGGGGIVLGGGRNLRCLTMMRYRWFGRGDLDITGSAMGELGTVLLNLSVVLLVPGAEVVVFESRLCACVS